MAALNAGSLNYLKIKSDGTWAWPPMLFDNPVEKVAKFVEAMRRLDVVPECECFDTGIVRSVAMFEQAKLLQAPIHVSLVMGVASGMPAKASWLPLLVEEMTPTTEWQTILIGRQEVWPVHRKAAELGGHLRTGLEDTFYLPDGSKAASNGPLIEALVKVAREVGREPASPAEARRVLGLGAKACCASWARGSIGSRRGSRATARRTWPAWRSCASPWPSRGRAGERSTSSATWSAASCCPASASSCCSTRTAGSSSCARWPATSAVAG
jgi:hypothetical protein